MSSINFFAACQGNKWVICPSLLKASTEPFHVPPPKDKLLRDIWFSFYDVITYAPIDNTDEAFEAAIMLANFESVETQVKEKILDPNLVNILENLYSFGIDKNYNDTIRQLICCFILWEPAATKN